MKVQPFHDLVKLLNFSLGLNFLKKIWKTIRNSLYFTLLFSFLFLFSFFPFTFFLLKKKSSSVFLQCIPLFAFVWLLPCSQLGPGKHSVQKMTVCSQCGMLGAHDTFCPIITNKFDHLVKVSVCQISPHYAPQQALTPNFIIHWWFFLL